MKFDISKLSPCSGGAKYYESQPDFKTAWENCQRGDWMLWFASKLGVDMRTITLAKGLCAKTVLHLMKDERSIKAVEAAIEYGRGTVADDAMSYATINAAAASAAAAAIVAADSAAEDVAAADAAATAYYAASNTAAITASAAYYAAANTAAYAASAAAVAVSAANAAAADDDAYAAQTENLKQTANICREILTEAVFNKIMSITGSL